MIQIPKFAFLGTPLIAVWVLEELEKAGFLPSLVITNPDALQGRNMVLTPSPVAEWAKARNIETLKPTSLKGDDVPEALRASGCELIIVAAYGKIIPESILDIPKYKSLNVHPSLLPKLRGASPIRSAILENINPTGVSIMILTKGMDEGPLLAQETITIPHVDWPIPGGDLDKLLARQGGILLATVLPHWINGEIELREQDHAEATYTKKITKEMGEIDLNGDHYQNLLKIRAFNGWPGTYFFHEKDGKKIRVKIVDADLSADGTLEITKIIPEGKKQTTFAEYFGSH